MKITLKQSILSALTFGLLLGNVAEISAQQLPLFNEYSENAFILNPGMTGWDDVTAISATYRHQWTGMSDAPRTMSLGYRQYLNGSNLGLGGYVWRDQAGPTTFMGASFSTAYHLKLSDEKKGKSTRNRLAIGLSLSVMQYELKGDQLQFNDINDPLATSVDRSKILPDAGAGIFYYNDNVYVGVSAPQLLRMKVNYDTNGGIANLQREPHFYVSSGVKLPLKSKKENAKPQFLMPTIWVKYAPVSPIHVNVGARYFWNDMIGVGAAYSTDGTMIGDLHLNISNFVRFNYAFSIGVNGLANYLGTNHEFGLSFILRNNRKGWIFPTDVIKREPKEKKPKKNPGVIRG